MQRNRLIVRGLVVGALALGGAALSNGCSAASAIQNACCTEYQPGTDMSTVDFHVDANLQGQFRAFAQASGDMSVVAGQAVADATNACRNIAVDLGNDPNDMGANGKAGTDLMNFWCAAAVTQINATFTATGVAKGALKIDVTPAQCTASLQASATCQGNCQVNGSCDIKANPPVCMGGKLDIDCKGECDVTAMAPTIDCTGTCMGMCSGSCEAQGGVAVNCTGKCDGTCAAGTGAGQTGIQADGSCNGTCNGKCTMSATAPSVQCMGTCSGQCNAACTTSPGQASVKCSGTCKADYTPISCTGGTLSGGCMVDAHCQANCNASVDARAECTPPTLTISVTGTVMASAQGQFNVLVNTIQLNVPKLFLIAKVRGMAFATEMNGVISGGVNVASTGSTCLVIIGSDITASVANFTAAVNASTSITAAVNM
jgi:hypothetical protein